MYNANTNTHTIISYNNLIDNNANMEIASRKNPATALLVLVKAVVAYLEFKSAVSLISAMNRY